MSARLVHWWIFGVVISVLPIGFLALRLLFDGANVSFTSVLGSGDLFLVTVAIGGPPIGSLFLVAAAKAVRVQAVAGFSIICIVLAAFCYASATSDALANTNRSAVAAASLIDFLLVIGLGTAALVLTQEQEA